MNNFSIIKIILISFFICALPVNAEIVKATGTYKHLGDKTKNESCKIALERAKKEAIIKTLGETVSSEIVSNCSEVDGEYNCERNQFSLLELKGDLSGTQTLSKEYKVLDDGVLICKVDIRTNVTPIKQNVDPSFQFDVSMNERTFRSGEIMEIEINTSKKMYISIFQWLPYGGRKFNKITKVFPNEQFNKNTNNLIKSNLLLKYEAYFPEEIKKKMVDEYLVFVASDKEIPWLDEYARIDGLKKQLVKSKVLIEKHYMGYVILK